MHRAQITVACVATTLILYGSLPLQARQAPAPPQRSQAIPNEPGYDECVRLYRRGETELAITRLTSLLGNISGASQTPPRDITEWTSNRRRLDDRGALEASLLLLSDAFFHSGETFAGPAEVFILLSPTRRLLSAIAVTHGNLESIATRTTFLRCWYLLWEAYAQGYGWLPASDVTDYLEFGLAKYPDDPELAMSAGSRYELRWWSRPDNPLRVSNGTLDSNDRALRAAARWFRLSVSAKPDVVESRLRLGRVLFLLDELPAAHEALQAALSSVQAMDPAMRYIGLLFLGELEKSRGDRVAARAAFDAATALVPMAQSARLAAAHMAHADGQRSAASDAVIRALSSRSDGSDPWWWYVRGQFWRVDTYRDAARALVRQ